MNLPTLIKNMCKTSRDMWERGWAEANGGNISLRLDAEQRKIVDFFKARNEWQMMPEAFPSLGGEFFMLTATGSYLRNIELAPERDMGIIEVSPDGSAWRILWGFEPEGRPTSELVSHLGAHVEIMKRTNGRDHAVIHTHAPSLIALTYVMPDLDTRKLSQLIWSMHTECPVVFPEGVGFLKWIMPGSTDLGHATAEALKRHSVIVWEHHGAFGSGRNLDEAFGRIYVAEKSASIYLAAQAAGGVKNPFPAEHIRAIAKQFGVKLDESLL